MPKKLFHWPLQTLLSIQFLTVAVIPIVIASLLEAWLVLPKINKSHDISQQALAKSISGQVSIYLENAASNLQVLASLAAKQAQPRQTHFELLDVYTNSQVHFNTIYLTDKSGRIIDIGLPPERSHLSENYLDLDMSNYPIFQHVQQNQAESWSDVILSTVSGHLSVAYAIPVGEGVLIGEISVEELPKLAQDLAQQYNVTTMILDQNRQLIAHPDILLSQQQINLSNLPLVLTAEQGKPLSQPFEFNHQELQGTATLIEKLNWMVIVAQPRDELEMEQAAINGILVASIVASIFIAAILAMFLAKVLISGFSNATSQAKELALGHYSIEPSPSHIKELHQLGLDLQTTGREIEQRELHIVQLNENLEQRVEARTEALKHSNKELKLALNNLKLTQEQLIQSEKLSALGSMVAGVSHELNTPIGNSLIASTTLAESTREIVNRSENNQLTKSSFDNYIHEVSQGSLILERNLNRASELIHSFKQIAVDQASAKRRNFEFRQHVNEVLMALHPMIKNTAVKIETDLPAEIYLDSYPGALSQIFTNLIQNALKHAFPNNTGTIRITAEEQGEQELVITLSDNGIGMPEEMLNAIFDPFFTTKLGQGGSGLGLHIVHNLVTKVLQGSIEVESQLNVGTRMTLRLPEVLKET